jgi:hypothetical protein
MSGGGDTAGDGAGAPLTINIPAKNSAAFIIVFV